jgi:hypothetical protein
MLILNSNLRNSLSSLNPLAYQFYQLIQAACSSSHFCNLEWSSSSTHSN